MEMDKNRDHGLFCVIDLTSAEKIATDVNYHTRIVKDAAVTDSAYNDLDMLDELAEEESNWLEGEAYSHQPRVKYARFEADDTSDTTKSSSAPTWSTSSAHLYRRKSVEEKEGVKAGWAKQLKRLEAEKLAARKQWQAKEGATAPAAPALTAAYLEQNSERKNKEHEMHQNSSLERPHRDSGPSFVQAMKQSSHLVEPGKRVSVENEPARSDTATFVRPMLDASASMMLERQQSMQDALSHADRREKKLFEFVLGLDFSTLPVSPTAFTDLPSEVPTTFRSCDHYLKIFEPLLWSEIRASILDDVSKKYRDKTGFTWIPTQVNSLLSHDDRLDELSISRPSDAKNGSHTYGSLHGLQSLDLCVMIPGENLSNRPSTLTLEKLTANPNHFLAIVSEVDEKSTSLMLLREASARHLPPVERMKEDTRVYLTFPIVSFVSGAREWQAISCVKHDSLLPLAPYLMSGSPVVSTLVLAKLKENISSKLSILADVAGKDHMKASKVLISLLADVHRLEEKQVDMSALTKTQLPKFLKELKKNEVLVTCARVYSLESQRTGTNLAQTAEAIIRICAELLVKWKTETALFLAKSKASASHNNRSDIESALPPPAKKPRLDETPIETSIEEVPREVPKQVPKPLWAAICRSGYNVSQLNAMRFVSNTVTSMQDMRVALLQGPPGTGKTSTIVGMTSLLLAREPVLNVKPSLANRSRLLLCAPSNSAVDELLLRLSVPGTVLAADGEPRETKLLRLTGSLNKNRGENAKVSNLGSTDASVLAALELDSVVEERVRGSFEASEVEKAVDALESAKDALQREVHAFRLAPIHSSQDSKKKCGPRPKVNSKAPTYTACMNVQKKSKNVSLTSSTSSTNTTAEVATKEQVKSRVENLRSVVEERRRHVIFCEKRLKRYKLECRALVLAEADIVACTLNGAGRDHFIKFLIRYNVTFDTCIIDEAAQCTEPSTLIPLCYGCTNLILVGDPRQLPATVISPDASRAGLGQSLFERLEKNGHEKFMLTIQYRMLPEIRVFPSSYFYNNQLVDAESVSKQALQLFEIAMEETALEVYNELDLKMPESHWTSFVATLSCRIFLLKRCNFLDVVSTEKKLGNSYVNHAEAALCTLLAVHLQKTLGIFGTSLAIISPYRSQNCLIEELLHPKFSNTIEVNTVDGFQGREKDIIIFSCVRSGHGNTIGFLSDARRLNVIITRAKKCLIIVGNSSFLRFDKRGHWIALYNHMKKCGDIIV